MIFVAKSFALCAAASNARYVKGLNSGDTRLITTLPEEISLVGLSQFDQVRRRNGKIDRVSAISLNTVAPIIDFISMQSLEGEIGIFMGNMLGGWEFGEKELRVLHTEGPNRVSAFQATAWFPAAAQGEISIAHSLVGYSKTMSGGLACGLEAFLVAYDALMLGKIEMAIVGACDSLMSKFAISGVSDIESKMIGEASCFFLLSKSSIAGGTALKLEWQPSSALNFDRILMDYEDVAQHNLLNREPFYLAAQPLVELVKVIESARTTKRTESIRFFAGNAAYCFSINNES